MMHRKLSLFLGLLLFGFAFSQQPENRKEQLQKQNAELKKQIANINAELAKAKGETKLSLAYLASVNQKITLREKVVNNTQKEKELILSNETATFCPVFCLAFCLKRAVFSLGG